VVLYLQSDWIYLAPGATKKNGKLGETMFYCTDHVEAHIASNPHLLPEGIKAPTCTNSAAWRTGALKSSAAKAKNMGAKKKKKAKATTPKPATKAAKKANVTAKAAASAAAAAANADESNSEQFNDVNDMECENASDDDTIDTADETAEEVQEDNDSDDDNDDDETEANAAASQEEGLLFSSIAMGNSVLSMSARTNCSQRGPRRSRRAFKAAGSGAANKGNCLAFCMVRSNVCSTRTNTHAARTVNSYHLLCLNCATTCTMLYQAALCSKLSCCWTTYIHL
jgi:hypothetical protein